MAQGQLHLNVALEGLVLGRHAQRHSQDPARRVHALCAHLQVGSQNPQLQIKMEMGFK